MGWEQADLDFSGNMAKKWGVLVGQPRVLTNRGEFGQFQVPGFAAAVMAYL